MLDKGYFGKTPNAYDSTSAADQVAKGDAAMTLMGTWITGYWDGNGLKAGVDYDYFPFPIIDSSIPDVAVGTIDGWDVPAASKNPDCAKKLILWLLKPENQAVWAKGQGGRAGCSQQRACRHLQLRPKRGGRLPRKGSIRERL